MQSEKSYIIWMPRCGTGKARQLLIRPVYILSLFITLFSSVLSIPFLETKVIELNIKLEELEQKKTGMESEIANLNYLKENLANIEMEDTMLSNYFGIDDNTFSRFSGTGGALDLAEYSTGINNKNDLNISPHDLPAKLEVLKNNLKVYSRLLEEKDYLLEYTPNILPVDSKEIRFSSYFGWRKNPFTKTKDFHAGLDISGKKGTKIIAPANGIVIREGYDQRLGNYIVMQHGENLRTIFGHLSSINVAEGDELKRGDKIGLMGNSGLSTSNHLHYTVIKNDRAINPMQYILDISIKS